MMDNLITKAKMREAISETILTCWEKIGQMKQDRYFRTWMTRILINKCNEFLQTRKIFQSISRMQMT